MADTRVTLLGETPITSDLMDYFRLDGKVALVTGASSGIGKRLARALHAAGAEVMVTARREERLKELCGELGTRADYMACNLPTRARWRIWWTRRSGVAAVSTFS